MNQYELQNAAFKIDGYFTPPRDVAQVGAAFAAAKGQCLVHIREAVSHVEEMDLSQFLQRRKNTPHVAKATAVFEIAETALAQRIAKRLISESQPFEMTRNADGTFQISVPYPGTQVSAEIEEHAQESSPEALAQRERLVKQANETFGSNTLQIDAEAPHSEGDDGTWVPAWVLVQPVDAEDDEDGGPRAHTP